MLSIFEYDEELHFKMLRDEGYESGYAKGHESGMENGERRINKLNSILLDLGRFDDLKRATGDKEYPEQLMLELLPEEIQNI